MGKRGQFYLIATIIIIVIIVGFVVIYNYSETSSSGDLKKLKQELEIESEKVLDYAVYNDEDVNQKMTDFVGHYSDYPDDKVNLYFIFGNSDSITAIAYQDSSDETISVDPGTGYQEITGDGTTYDFSNPSDEVKLKIGSDVYPFEIKPKGEHFYFVLSKELEGEKYVVTN